MIELCRGSHVPSKCFFVLQIITRCRRQQSNVSLDWPVASERQQMCGGLGFSRSAGCRGDSGHKTAKVCRS